MFNPFFKKLVHRRIWTRILVERLSEPLHLNLIAFLVGPFLPIEKRIFLDLVMRQYHAFGLLNAINKARALGKKSVTVVEFGVASGAGLMNMCDIGARLSKRFGI